MQRIFPTNGQTQCTMKKPALTARQPKNKKIDVNFNGGRLTSDAGALLLRQVERKTGLLARIDRVIRDPRDPLLVEHEQSHLIGQRIFSIALGYEDVNDQQELRHDPALLASVKDSIDEKSPLGSPSTISRLENRITEKEMADLTKIFVQLFIESYDEPPKEITLDFDATDDTIHGNQEGRHFNGFYDDYCFLPLYITNVKNHVKKSRCSIAYFHNRLKNINLCQKSKVLFFSHGGTEAQRRGVWREEKPLLCASVPPCEKYFWLRRCRVRPFVVKWFGDMAQKRHQPGTGHEP